MPLPPRSSLFPYTTLFRSEAGAPGSQAQQRVLRGVSDRSIVQTAADRTGVRVRLFDTSTGTQGRNALTLSADSRSEEHTSELQSQSNLVCRLLLEKKKKQN